MKTYRLLLLFILTACLAVFTAINAQDNSDKNKQVKVLPKTLEIIEVSQTAEQCPNKKGTTVRLRVISESPIDVVRYANLGSLWSPAEFMNQKKGDEITTFMCSSVAKFKFYSRAAGSSEKFPKP